MVSNYIYKIYLVNHVAAYELDHKRIQMLISPPPVSFNTTVFYPFCECWCIRWHQRTEHAVLPEDALFPQQDLLWGPNQWDLLFRVDQDRCIQKYLYYRRIIIILLIKNGNTDSSEELDLNDKNVSIMSYKSENLIFFTSLLWLNS